jgi:hypothetical protein
MMRRVITIRVGWLALAGVLILVALLVLLIRRPVAAPAITTDDTTTGRQYVQPTGNPPYWPIVYRAVQPEDLD